MSEFEIVGAEVHLLGQDWKVIHADEYTASLAGLSRTELLRVPVDWVGPQAQLWDACGTIAAVRLAQLAGRP